MGGEDFPTGGFYKISFRIWGVAVQPRDGHNNKVTMPLPIKPMSAAKRLDPKQPAERQREDERMRDVLVLLQHLAESEETTIKLIMGCLYDVGSVNFINQKFRFKPLNRLMKLIAGLAKPLVKILGLRWFRKKCPPLIVNWLRSKVSFKGLDQKPASPPPPKPVEVQTAPPPPQATPQAVSVVQPLPAMQPSSVVQSPPTAQLTSAAQPALLLPSDPATQEIKRLRTQVRVLTGMLAGTLIALGGAAVWQFNSLNPEKIQPIHQTQSTSVLPPQR